jgi:hypothetical protein
MSMAAVVPRLEARNGIAAFQVLDAEVSTPDMSRNGPSHAVRME